MVVAWIISTTIWYLRREGDAEGTRWISARHQPATTGCKRNNWLSGGPLSQLYWRWGVTTGFTLRVIILTWVRPVGCSKGGRWTVSECIKRGVLTSWLLIPLSATLRSVYSHGNMIRANRLVGGPVWFTFKHTYNIDYSRNHLCQPDSHTRVCLHQKCSIFSLLSTNKHHRKCWKGPIFMLTFHVKTFQTLWFVGNRVDLVHSKNFRTLTSLKVKCVILRDNEEETATSSSYSLHCCVFHSSPLQACQWATVACASCLSSAYLKTRAKKKVSTKWRSIQHISLLINTYVIVTMCKVHLTSIMSYVIL